jgi:type II secretory pathway component GspD/PulD (secretin)
VGEDTAAAHQRIAQYLAQIDVAPRQVLVEAHVLQVALTDEDRHGINLKGLADLDGSKITLEGSGFADENPTGPAISLRVDGRDMQGFLDMIRANSNSRTLASPKLSVVNHQEAKIQIGQRLPYAVATTTQTSTIQSVEFLEVGVVLTVRPVITDDGRVLLNVLPKVSGGKITANGFPEEETTEVQTTILMPDGGGVIIGGLIREEDNQTHASLPFVGKIPVLGHLFKRRTSESRRNELIIALVTHVMPDGYGPRHHEAMELDQTLPEYAAREILAPAPVIQYDH